MSKFTKGNSGNPNGRPKGSANKTTNKIREAFTRLVEDNLENMTTWLTKVAETSPKEALTIINQMAEYTTPKLARVENKIETDEEINEVKIEIVKRSNTDEWDIWEELGSTYQDRSQPRGDTFWEDLLTSAAYNGQGFIREG